LPSGAEVGVTERSSVGMSGFAVGVAQAKPVADVGSALDPDVVSRMIARRDTDELDQLTPREREVLGLMAEGRSNRGIAETLIVTEDAVEAHVNNLVRKLDITGAPTDHRRVLAVLALLRRVHSDEN
jgi:DNA-binding NarL/FixJ family response regulator